MSDRNEMPKTTSFKINIIGWSNVKQSRGYVVKKQANRTSKQKTYAGEAWIMVGEGQKKELQNHAIIIFCYEYSLIKKYSTQNSNKRSLWQEWPHGNAKFWSKKQKEE